MPGQRAFSFIKEFAITEYRKVPDPHLMTSPYQKGEDAMSIDNARVALLISGGGTTARAIIQACKAGRIQATPALVIASNAEAGGIQKALEEGIAPEDVMVISRRECRSGERFGQAILSACTQRGIDIVGQYGWMVKTPPNVLVAFPKRMINQHPGPLDPGNPDFGGKGMFGRRVHYARLLFVQQVGRDWWTEATAQWVAEEYDRGAIIGATQVSIFPGDDTDSLQQRVLPVEHELQIETLKRLVEGSVTEIVREQRLVLPGEESLLDWTKQEAATRFPDG